MLPRTVFIGAYLLVRFNQLRVINCTVNIFSDIEENIEFCNTADRRSKNCVLSF